MVIGSEREIFDADEGTNLDGKGEEETNSTLGEAAECSSLSERPRGVYSLKRTGIALIVLNLELFLVEARDFTFIGTCFVAFRVLGVFFCFFGPCSLRSSRTGSSRIISAGSFIFVTGGFLFREELRRILL